MKSEAGIKNKCLLKKQVQYYDIRRETFLE